MVLDFDLKLGSMSPIFFIFIFFCNVIGWTIAIQSFKDISLWFPRNKRGGGGRITLIFHPMEKRGN